MLFLDEPTTGLDTRSRQELWNVIRSLADAGTTVFLTTQYLEEADRLADRIAVLDGGGIAAEGTADELKARIGGDVVELRDADGELAARAAHRRSVHGLRAAMDELDRTPGRRCRRRRRSPSGARASTTCSSRSPPAQRGDPRIAPNSSNRSDDHDHPDTPLRPPAHLRGFTAESTFITRSLIHSMRDVEALLMADRAARDAHADVHLHLRQRDRPVGRLRRLRRARHHPALRRDSAPRRPRSPCRAT